MKTELKNSGDVIVDLVAGLLAVVSCVALVLIVYLGIALVRYLALIDVI